ncbi:MAG: nucleotidyltransferase domain-containing protein [Candidatus Woesearchaeota archaeon]
MQPYTSCHDINDIILFGSSVKGKNNYQDIDILIIFTKTINKDIEYALRKSIANSHITSITQEEFALDTFRAKEGIFLEGISLLTHKNISHSIGFDSFAFIQYDLQSLTKSQKVQFYYALQGRNKNPGILQTHKGTRFADNTLLVTYNTITPYKDFFAYWDIPITIIPSLIPQRLTHLLTPQ